MATVKIFSPYQVLSRPLTLKPRNRKSPVLGSKVRVESVRLDPAGDDSGLAAMIGKSGFHTFKGLKAHDTNPSGMWQHDWETNLVLEFELPDAVPLSAVEVWNFNAEWRTTNGIRNADIAVSLDGKNWQTVRRDAEFAEAGGTADYDEPTVVNLEGVTARKVRFQNLAAHGTSARIGLSKVVFHTATNSQAAPVQPEDGATGVSVGKIELAWVAGQSATNHRVFLGSSPQSLVLVENTREAKLQSPGLAPATTYFWRVDEVQPDGSVVTGRLGRFETAGLVAQWKLDAKAGNSAEDATGHQFAGRVRGDSHWLPGQGPLAGAFEFDGHRNYIQCGDFPEFGLRDGLAVSLWLKVRQFDKSWQAIVGKGEHAWRFQRNDREGKVRFVAAGPESTQPAGPHAPYVISKHDLDDGQWHHLVGLYDGKRVALYLDGELEDSIAASGPLLTSGEPVLIGENSEARGRYFNGWMSDVRLYGYGLSEPEIRALYQTKLQRHGSTERAEPQPK